MNSLMCNSRGYKYLTLCLRSKQLKNKTKQNIDYTIIRMSHNVTIRFRYTLFAHKLARASNLGSGSFQMLQQQQKPRVETAVDWAMTKLLVSCAIAPLYENVECRLSVDLVKKKYFSYVSSWSQTCQHLQKRGFYNTAKIVIIPLPTGLR